MKCVLAFVTFTLLVCMNSAGNPNPSYVREACKVTRFRDLCIHTLSPYSSYAKQNHRRWAESSVTVTQIEAKNVSIFLKSLKGRVRFRRRQQIALSDCIEVLRETIDNVYKSLSELKKLNARTFQFQMENVETYMSSALTDEDTCLDGFTGRKGKAVKKIRGRITKLGQITSNALALVARLASDHQRKLRNP